MLNNFTYSRHYKVKDGFRWKCSKQFTQSCRAFLVISNEVLLVKGRNGKDLLMLNGYTYYQHKLLRDGFRWSCTQMGSRSCRGFLHVTKKMLVVRAQTEHTHPPSTYFFENIKKQSSKIDDNRKSACEKDTSNLSLKIASIHGRFGF
ncbi:unnamed protein product [Euphydryas editha]|uniref:FLYWCH-type domain-containing protein n=1 Tax=Euphydryas editha TaxID=104508 RepID=A0AAU9TDU4_EUPED|nr:unnamed protein product [Euphydryas editha]